MLREMKNDELLADIRRLVRNERRITQDILARINEVEHRKLYAELGYPSVMEWLVKDLGYSHSAAYRRMQTARLLRDVPAASESIQSGDVNLTTLAQLQTAICGEERRTGERMEPAAKQNLLEKIENQSAQQTERILATVFPEATVNKERAKAIDDQHTRLTLISTAEQMTKLHRVRELSSHSHCGGTWGEIIEMLADKFIKQKDPLAQKPVRRSNANPKATAAAEQSVDLKRGRGSEADLITQRASGAATHFVDGSAMAAKSTPVYEEKYATPASDTGHNQKSQMPTRACKRKALPRGMRRAVWLRDGGKCTYRDSRTGRVCGSKFQVEVDHVEAWALGGVDSMENLRCLCRTHNALAAEKIFGAAKMDAYRKSEGRRGRPVTQG